MTEYTPKEVVQALAPLFPEGRLSYARLNYYSRMGIVTPTGDTRTPRGRTRYRFNDVLALAFYLEMRKMGFKAEHLENAIAEIQRWRRRPRRGKTVTGKHGGFQWWFWIGELVVKVERALGG